MQTAKRFKNGRSQAVGLPAEVRFEGEAVRIRRDPETGDVFLSPLNKSFAVWLKERDRLLANMTEKERKELDAFMADRDQARTSSATRYERPRPPIDLAHRNRSTKISRWNSRTRAAFSYRRRSLGASLRSAATSRSTSRIRPPCA